MKKTLYIHIGTGKTGTTALQDFFLTNRDTLKESGIEYANSGLLKNNHHLICRNYLRKDKKVQDNIDVNLSALNLEIKNSTSDIFLVSSEYFPGLSIDEIFEIKNKIEAKVIPIVYLRRQDEFLESWYAQIVKAYQNRDSIYLLKERLIKDGIFDYLTLTENWSQVNDDKNIIVRPYEKKSFTNGNIFYDFIDSLELNINKEKLNLPSKDPNPSIRPNQIKLALELFDFCTPNQRVKLFTPINKFNDESQFFLSVSERQALIDEYSSVNSIVATKHLGRDYLFENKHAKESDVNHDIITGCFIDKFIYFLFFNNKDLLKEIEEPIIKFLKIESQKYSSLNMSDTELRLLQLAFLVRPNGKHINLLLNNCTTKKFNFTVDHND